MKKLFLFLFVFSLASMSFGARKIRGKIIRDKDTLQVLLLIPFGWLSEEPNFISLQGKIKYLDEKGVKAQKVKLKPTDANEILFTYQNSDINDIAVRMVSTYGRSLNTSCFNYEHKFLRIELDGPMSVYKYYYSSSGAGTVGPGGAYHAGGSVHSEEYILCKNGQKLFRPSWMFFRKEMEAYVSDCPTLVDKIENKQFTRNNLYEIAIYYNRNCVKK